MKPFRFKQFTVRQDRSAMKVGTDGILLGAWAHLGHHPDSILDIGAGTGLIALQLAQRSTAGTIDALEVEERAHGQCVENFENSPWADRLFCYHASFQEFAEEMEDSYDLIVSNPPFYAQGPAIADARRNLARKNSFLPYGQLLEGVSRLLSPKGEFAMILPYGMERPLLELAASMELFPCRMLRVRGHPQASIKRSLLQFGPKRSAPQIDELVLESSPNSYSSAYRELTREFYLHM